MGAAAAAPAAWRGQGQGVPPFEVHDALGDPRGGVEGWQELLPELDGLDAEHLQEGPRAPSQQGGRSLQEATTAGRTCPG